MRTRLKRVGQRPIDPTPAPPPVSVSDHSLTQHSDSISAPLQSNDPIPHPPENVSNGDSDEFHSFSSFTGPGSCSDGRQTESLLNVHSQHFDSISSYIVDICLKFIQCHGFRIII